MLYELEIWKNNIFIISFSIRLYDLLPNLRNMYLLKSHKFIGKLFKHILFVSCLYKIEYTLLSTLKNCKITFYNNDIYKKLIFQKILFF